MRVNLGTKIALISSGLLLVTIVLLVSVTRTRIASDARQRTATYSESEIEQVRDDLRGYVDMAYRILADNYENTSGSTTPAGRSPGW